MSKQDKKDWGKFKQEHFDNEDEGSLFEEQFEQAEEAALDHPSYEVLEEKLTKAEQKAHENWENAVRAQAELENVRRRMEKEVVNTRKYAVEKLISSLLPVVDSLEQALQLVDKNADTAMHEGLELTMKLFLDVLQKFDVSQLDPLGKPFDPQQHEAMTMQPDPNSPPNTVLAVFQKGYQLNDRIIRPARVIVSKNE